MVLKHHHTTCTALAHPPRRVARMNMKGARSLCRLGERAQPHQLQRATHDLGGLHLTGIEYAVCGRAAC